MPFSRRDFLTAVAAGALAPRALAFDTPRPGPFPFAGMVDAFLSQPTRSLPPRLAASPQASYLPVIEGIVRFFRQHQDTRGAIIDPYEAKERQYSTPAFALAAAAVCTPRRDAALLAAARQAMEAASADLAAGRAADGHADFFTVLLLHADRLLARLVSPAEAARWRGSLRAVVPEKVYRFQPAGPVIQNWNLVAASGEYLRARDGFGSDMPWVETSLARQTGRFTASGLYRDPMDPLAYDLFARLWATDLVAEGYVGSEGPALATLAERGAWMSLFMQSPHGEVPCGGRSAHHQWNEAAQAVVFETCAGRAHRRGQLAAAGAFRRAAGLSLQSVARWVRPSGELWIVKNRLDPRLRHGYESYSFHSQYNLLTAAMLALAWLRADDRIRPSLCPADTGGHAFALQPEFHKVFLAAAGCQVEIDTGADLHYNPTGILRLHHRHFPAQVLSDGVTPLCAYTVPVKPSRALAFGPEWQDRDGAWHSLASRGAEDLEPTGFRVVRADSRGIEAELTYTGRLEGGATAVRERVVVSAGGVEVTHSVDGEVGAVRQTVPILLDDGQGQSRITTGAGGAEVERGGARLRVSGSEGASVTRAGLREPCRNGFTDALVVEGQGRSSRCRVLALSDV